jgi:hypothetical protein
MPAVRLHIGTSPPNLSGLRVVARSDSAWFVLLRKRDQRGSNALSRTGSGASATSAMMSTRLEAGETWLLLLANC